MSDASDPRRVLAELERRAHKRFGQHFLARPSIVERMVRGSGVRAGDRVVEIGPGLGILTEALLKAGAEVTAVEVDRDLAARLREVLPQVRLVEADATRVDWTELCPGEGWRVVANLPYNVGTGLVVDLLEHPGRFTSLTVMLQAEVIERLVAQPGTKAYGALTVQVAARAEASILLAVPPEAFVPPPKVRSLVARLDLLPAPRTGAVPPAFLDRVVRVAFAQRRKTLRNTLAAGFGAEASAEALRSAGIDAGLRAEVLSLDAFVALGEALLHVRGA